MISYIKNAAETAEWDVIYLVFMKLYTITGWICTLVGILLGLQGVLLLISYLFLSPELGGGVWSVLLWIPVIACLLIFIGISYLRYARASHQDPVMRKPAIILLVAFGFVLVSIPAMVLPCVFGPPDGQCGLMGAVFLLPAQALFLVGIVWFFIQRRKIAKSNG